MLRKKKRAQSIIEYFLLLAAIMVALVLANKSSVFSVKDGDGKTVSKSFTGAFRQKLHNMRQDLGTRIVGDTSNTTS